MIWLELVIILVAFLSAFLLSTEVDETYEFPVHLVLGILILIWIIGVALGW